MSGLAFSVAPHKAIKYSFKLLMLWTQARQHGILNESAGFFVNSATGKQMSLDDAVDAGLVTAQFEEVAAGKAASEPSFETKTFAIGFVVDQVSSDVSWFRRLDFYSYFISLLIDNVGTA